MCHLGITRMTHVVRSRNLPYSVEDVKRIINSCQICAENKPRFYKPPQATLVKATQPFERLNLDFKGPLPSKTQNKYMLTIIDEYSRFPFVIPCPDLTATTVIQGLCSLFTIIGVPAYIHTDQGAAFMSEDLKSFLHEQRVAVSRTSPYNPQGNGPCERYNGIIWKTVQLALANRKMPISKWESVIPEALNTIRTLLCICTNATPHEGFFSFQQRSSTSTSRLSWLAQPGIVLLKHHVHHSKHDPLVSKVKLIEVTPQYAQIKTAEGSQSTVSLRDLALAGNTSEEATEMENREYPVFRTSPVKLGDQIPCTSCSDTLPNESDYPYEPSSPSDSEERPIPQKRPHPTSETDTYFSDTQQPKQKKKMVPFQG